MSHVLKVKGTISLIHAVTSFVLDWKKNNENEDYKIKTDSYVHPATQTMPGVLPEHSMQFNPAIHASNQGNAGAWSPAPEIIGQAIIEPEAAPAPKKRRSSAEVAAEKAAKTAAPAPAAENPATPAIPMPDWIKAAQAPVAQTGAPTIPPAHQPWLDHPDTQTSPVPAWPGAPIPQPVIPVAQMPAPVPHVPGLEPITARMQYIANDPAKRQKVAEFLASWGFSSIDQLPAESYAQTANILDQIIAGQI